MSLMNGLSTMGAGVAQFAGTAGLEAQKADLAKQQLQFADQLATTHELNVTQPFQASQQAALLTGQGQNAARVATISGQYDLQGRQAMAGATVAAAKADAAAREFAATTEANMLPPDVKEAMFLAGASPEQRQAYSMAQNARLGLPAWVTGMPVTPSSGGDSGQAAPLSGSAATGTGTAAGGSSGNTTGGSGAALGAAAPGGSSGTALPSGTAAPGASAAPSTGSTAPSTGATPTTTPTGRTVNPDALNGVPSPAQELIKGMVEGRISPPGSFAMSRPGSIWLPLMQKAMQYDPSFDETSWAGRVATRKDFTSGKSAQAITAMNTALGHAGLVADDLDELNNSGIPFANAGVNWFEGKFLGDARVTNASEAIDALASEARKVFAASGGGNLTELENWEKNFPMNGSPAQQKGALNQFVELLDSRLGALSDQHNRGMQTTAEPLSLLGPKAREVYQKLTGSQPTDATGYQSGKPPGTTPAAQSGGRTRPAPDARDFLPKSSGLASPAAPPPLFQMQ